MPLPLPLNVSTVSFDFSLFRSSPQMFISKRLPFSRYLADHPQDLDVTFSFPDGRQLGANKMLLSIRSFYKSWKLVIYIKCTNRFCVQILYITWCYKIYFCPIADMSLYNEVTQKGFLTCFLNRALQRPEIKLLITYQTFSLYIHIGMVLRTFISSVTMGDG